MLHANNKYDYRGSKQKRGSLNESGLPLRYDVRNGVTSPF